MKQGPGPSDPRRMRTTVTLLPGDGIGPECTRAVQRVFAAAGAPIDWEECEAGGRSFARGVASGVPPETAASIERTRLALKGPLETPVGRGERSANVTLRMMFELYGNVRPTLLLPGVQSVFAGRPIDLVLVRENVEDLYAGIEHMQTPGVAQALKLVTAKGCDKIVRLAFALAQAQGRRRVTCVTKANILKLTEGMLQRTFAAIAPEYPEITTDHMLVDNCAHQLVRRPEQFDVLVMTNMNGDILSDLAAGLAGGLGLAPSANLGDGIAMFEAVHGSAPDIAGQDKANPTAMLLAGVMLLRHLGLHALATDIEHALILTFEQGTHVTGDMARRGPGVGTSEFTEAVTAKLGQRSPHWGERQMAPLALPRRDRPIAMAAPVTAGSEAVRRDRGADVFVECTLQPDALARELEELLRGSPLQLEEIGNRGAIVHPPRARADLVDHFRCRILMRDPAATLDEGALLAFLQRLGQRHRWMHVEKVMG